MKARSSHFLRVETVPKNFRGKNPGGPGPNPYPIYLSTPQQKILVAPLYSYILFYHYFCTERSFVWWLTARQRRIGQFVPTAGGWNRLRRLRMANERQCISFNTFIHNVTQFTVKHSSYKMQKTGYSERDVLAKCIIICNTSLDQPNFFSSTNLADLVFIILTAFESFWRMMPRTSIVVESGKQMRTCPAKEDMFILTLINNLSIFIHKLLIVLHINVIVCSVVWWNIIE